eukprot:TRINITY_DN821_c0_g1_i1.p1 TRINITY_DN821_c0_g1~~TRINITY_DN821_c0_g1_i1.p1  ORF type:complete len:572 (+),score=68.41 TRINITY_DN821_c0_g1_i1:81-1796(+)
MRVSMYRVGLALLVVLLGTLVQVLAWDAGMIAAMTPAAQSNSSAPGDFCLFSHSYTVKIKTRDGIELNTVIHVPWSIFQPSFRVSTFLVRTPYNADSANEAYWAKLTAACYVVAVQDQRGRYASTGTYAMWGKAAQDGYDTMAWLVQQDFSNGVIYSAGGSADAIAAYMQPMLSPPWLKGQLLAVGTSNVYKTTYQNGAYRESLISGWLTGQGEHQMIAQVQNNERFSDYWNPTTMAGHFGAVDFPSVHYGGWYDIFQQGTIDAFTGYSTQGQRDYQNLTYLVMDAHGHCAADGVIPHPNANGSLPLLIANGLFSPVSNGSRPAPPAGYKRVNLYVMGPGTTGSIGDFWTYRDTWPTPAYTSFYLTSKGSLQTQVEPSSARVSYTYDPRDPVKTVGGNNLLIPCGAYDQTPVLPPNRKDVVLYSTAPLQAPVAIVGRLEAQLYVSSSCKDTDFTAKLIDKYPDGRAINLADGIIRMRWRNSDTTPELLTPGQVYNVSVDLWSSAYIFNAGHSIQLAISSSNAPRFSVNPNTGEPLNQPVTQNITAVNQLLTGANTASRLVLPVVNIKDLLL